MDLVDEQHYLFIEDLVLDVKVMLLHDKLRELDPMVDEVVQQLPVLLAVTQQLVLLLLDHVLEG